MVVLGVGGGWVSGEKEGEVVRLEGCFWGGWLVDLERGWLVDLEGVCWGERGGEMVPWSLGKVEDVRRGMRMEREGRRRRVVQNMVR